MRRTIINIKPETKERLSLFKEKYFEVKDNDELINDLIDELEKCYSKQNPQQ